MYRPIELRNYTTFGIGGKADALFIESPEDVKLLTPDSVIIGRGSNVLVSDDGIRSPVAINRMSGLTVRDGEIYAYGGQRLSDLSRRAAEEGLSGLEWAAGIPGSVGGAVAMNAGAFGGCIADTVSFCDVFLDGKTVRLSAAECGFSYRKSVFIGGGGFVVGAAFRLTQSDTAAVIGKINSFFAKRKLTQPVGKSAGSVFKAADMPAGYYIDKAGLKGERAGGAYISEKHANFIINGGDATAKDVISLIEKAEKTVENLFGIRLEREIKLLGF